MSRYVRILVTDFPFERKSNPVPRIVGLPPSCLTARADGRCVHRSETRLQNGPPAAVQTVHMSAQLVRVEPTGTDIGFPATSV